nr:TonB-dependent receptor [uncultured Holophaga sp.]
MSAHRFGSRIILPLLVVGAAHAAGTSLTGTVSGPGGTALNGARVVLKNPLTGLVMSASTDVRGHFSLVNIPANTYHLEVFATGMQVLHRDLELRSPLELPLVLSAASAEVVVEEKLDLVEDHPSSHLDIGREAIDHNLAPVQSRAMESILLATPGFIADENGRFHFRGSHGQATYVIDGVPVSDQLHATFSNSLDPSQVESMEVITGGVSAEYGGKPVAVINMTTRSGLNAPNGFSGDAYLNAGSYGSREAGGSVQGSAGAFGYFVSGAASESNRFLDPVNFENLHNQGSTGRLFSRFDWILSAQDSLRVSLSGGRTLRDVPNLASQEAAGMNQRMETGDRNLSLGWDHAFSDALSLESNLYYRVSTSVLDPTAQLQSGFSEGGADTPVWAWQDRSLGSWGATTAITRRFSGGSTLKAGLQYQASPIHERFRFAITDQDLVTDSSDPLYAYSAAGGGNIFAFDERIKPTLASAFVQDDLHLGAWLLAMGLRYDRYTLRGQSTGQLQPRLGTSYQLSTGTVLRASYDRLMVTRENENLALSTSQKAWDLGPYAGTSVPALKPEIQDSYTLGAEQQLGKVARIMVEYWAKDSRNPGDNSQFFNTGVLFPISAARGFFRGWNTRLDLVPIHGFSGYVSLGHTRAVFEGPVTGGLQLEAAEVGAGEKFLIDHDEKLSGQMGLRFEQKGFAVQVQGRYDSGLVAGDPSEATGNPDLAFGTTYVHQDSEGTWRVKPHTIWDLGTSQTLALQGGRKLTLGADLLNVLDEKGLYNFLSEFGGTHVLPPRTWNLKVKYAF